MEKTYLKHDNKNNPSYKYFTQPKHDFLHQARKRLIKNYVLDPEVKLIG